MDGQQHIHFVDTVVAIREFRINDRIDQDRAAPRGGEELRTRPVKPCRIANGNIHQHIRIDQHSHGVIDHA